MNEFKKLNLVLLGSAAVIALSVGITALVFWNIDHLVVVHFDALQGIDRLGTKYDILAIGGLALALMGVNYFLSRALFSRDRFLAWLLAVGNAGLMILSSAALMAIIFNN